MFSLNNNKSKSFKSADILSTSQVPRLTVSSLNGPMALQKPTSKRRLAMINMSDNGKIPIQQNYTNGTIKKYLKLRNGKIYLFQTYCENNA